MRSFIRRLSLTGLAFAAGALAAAATMTLVGPPIGMANMLAWAQPRMTAQILLNMTTDELRWARTAVRVNLDTWEPGSETGRHEHPGPALLYVLEGELEEVQTDGIRVLRAGQAIWNRSRTPHNVRNRGDRVARALAVHLDPGR